MAGATYSVREVLEGQIRLCISGYLDANRVPFGTVGFLKFELESEDIGDSDMAEMTSEFWEKVISALPRPDAVSTDSHPNFCFYL